MVMERRCAHRGARLAAYRHGRASIPTSVGHALDGGLCSRRVPRSRGVAGRGRLVDVAATVLQMAGVERAAGLDGEPLSMVRASESVSR